MDKLFSYIYTPNPVAASWVQQEKTGRGACALSTGAIRRMLKKTKGAAEATPFAPINPPQSGLTIV